MTNAALISFELTVLFEYKLTDAANKTQLSTLLAKVDMGKFPW